MLVATLRMAQAMGLPLGSLEDLASVDGKKFIITPRGLVLEERTGDASFEHKERRKSGEGRTC